MRIIDADKLKEALRSNCKPELCHDINTAWCESCCRTNEFEDLIDNAPTVEARPQYGEWTEDGDCSVCGHSTMCDGWGRDVTTPFCPWCGAEMKKDGDSDG